MSGFGLSPYGSGPYGLTYSPAVVPQRGTVPESQYIDADGNLEIKADGTGSYKASNSSVQRVIVLLAMRAARPKKIEANFARDQEQRIRTALEPLTSGSAPAIEIVEIVAAELGRGGSSLVVRFRDLADSGQVREVAA